MGHDARCAKAQPEWQMNTGLINQIGVWQSVLDRDILQGRLWPDERADMSAPLPQTRLLRFFHTTVVACNAPAPDARLA
jgi:hypothetical protein